MRNTTLAEYVDSQAGFFQSTNC